MRNAATAEGLTYHDYCEKWGIVGPAQDRRIRRHEIAEADVSDGTRREMQSRTAWGDPSLTTPNGSVITAKAPLTSSRHGKRDV